MKKILLFLLAFTAWFNAFSQGNPQGVEMADGLRSSGKIYVVVLVIVIVFVGLALYLFALDRKIKKVERRLS